MSFRMIRIFLLFTCSFSSVYSQENTGKKYHTIIVGAGAAGLSASYTLINSGGIPYEEMKILESLGRLGGRAYKDTNFVSEFPLDLGPSYVQYPDEIRRIVGRSDMLKEPPGNGYGLPTFSNYSYWDFFNDYIAPKNQDAVMEYYCRVNSIDYRSSGSNDVITRCEDGRSFLSDHVIVTVPLPILQDGDINFLPPLPSSMTTNHPGSMWQGAKLFLEFRSDFFDTFYLRDLGSRLNDDGENLFWDYTSLNPPLDNGNTLMGGYILGDQSEPYIGLEDEQILQAFLDLLDDEFDGLASINYVRGLVRNWSKDPNFRGTLSSCGYDCYGNPSGAQNINNMVWIAGEAFPIDGNNGWVDAGAFSGDDAARQILRLSEGIRVSGLFWDRVRSDVTASPTNAPTSPLGPAPTLQPSPAPTTPAPTPRPTLAPTPAPTTMSPTRLPTLRPTPRPTLAPTPAPTTSPPTLRPTPRPTLATITTTSPSKNPVVVAPGQTSSCLMFGELCTVDDDCCSKICRGIVCRGSRERIGFFDEEP